jgi:hypothetical protein
MNKIFYKILLIAVIFLSINNISFAAINMSISPIKYEIE